MVSLFGVDLDGPLDAIKGATKDLFAGLDLGGAGRGDQSGVQARDPFGGWQAGQRDPFAGVRFGANSQLDNLQLGGDPFGDLRFGGNTGLAGLDLGDQFSARSGMPSLGGSPFAAFGAAADRAAAKHAADKVAADKAKAATATAGSTVTGGGTVNAAGVQGWLQAQRPNSPLIPIAGEIASYAQSKGVDPSLIFGQLQAESGFASDNGQGTRQNNPGNIMAPGADPAHGLIILNSYPTMLDGVKAQIDTLASYNQQYGARFGVGQNGKTHLSTEDLVAIYYVGPEAYARYGLQANDAGGSGPGGHGTVEDYLNRHVRPVQQAFMQFTTPAHPPAGTSYTGGTPGLASITGGSGSIGQEFGDTDFSATSGSLYDYGAAYGVHGHTGIDWAVPPGTQVYMPAGLSGTVITAGGTAFFRDEDENPASVSPQGQGELKIQMSDGTQLILGHMRNISVPVGTQLTAGQLVGLAGSANGGHVHIEVRVPDRSMPSGYRIVDPRAYLAGPTGGGGTQYP